MNAPGWCTTSKVQTVMAHSLTPHSWDNTFLLQTGHLHPTPKLNWTHRRIAEAIHITWGRPAPQLTPGPASPLSHLPGAHPLMWPTTTSKSRDITESQLHTADKSNWMATESFCLSFLPKTSFGLRVLSFPACVCLCVHQSRACPHSSTVQARTTKFGQNAELLD